MQKSTSSTSYQNNSTRYIQYCSGIVFSYFLIAFLVFGVNMDDEFDIVEVEVVVVEGENEVVKEHFEKELAFCDYCDIPMFEMERFCKDEIDKFYLEHKIIPYFTHCRKCGSFINFPKRGPNFRCNKTHHGARCEFKKSICHGSWLSQSRMKPEKLFRFVIIYLTTKPPRTEYIRQYLKINVHSIVDWGSFMREVMIYWCVQNGDTILGGEGRTVEIDEARSAIVNIIVAGCSKGNGCLEASNEGVGVSFSYL